MHQDHSDSFNPNTIFEFALPKALHVSQDISDVLGRRVTPLVDRDHKPSRHRFDWDGQSIGGKPVSSSIYFVRLTTRDFMATKTTVVVK
jgi:hypothetical protein